MDPKMKKLDFAGPFHIAEDKSGAEIAAKFDALSGGEQAALIFRMEEAFSAVLACGAKPNMIRGEG